MNESNVNQNLSKTRRPSFLKQQFIVNRRLQYFLIAFVFCTGACIVSLNLFFYQVFVHQAINIGATAENIDPAAVNSFLVSIDSVFNKLAIVSGAIMAIVTILGGLFLSHRIAGPIYRIEKILHSLNSGEKINTPVKFREGDFFREIENTLNELAEKIQTKDVSR